jgi:hypothetical protein
MRLFCVFERREPGQSYTKTRGKKVIDGQDVGVLNITLVSALIGRAAKAFWNDPAMTPGSTQEVSLHYIASPVGQIVRYHARASGAKFGPRDDWQRPSNTPPTASGDESRTPPASAPRPRALSGPGDAGRFGVSGPRAQVGRRASGPKFGQLSTVVHDHRTRSRNARAASSADRRRRARPRPRAFSRG